MAKVCPPWVGWFLLCPIRKLTENPKKIFSPFVRPGMTVLEPGSGMGFFTLPLARMVGENGRVVAVDVQDGMLSGLRKRADKAGLGNRVDCRLATEQSTGLEDLKEKADFAAAIHMVHETPDPGRFLREMFDALKPGGRLLVIEPAGHVSVEEFNAMLDKAVQAGFSIDQQGKVPFGRRALLAKAA